MSTSPNSKVLRMKQVTTQQTITPCSNSFKAFLKALDKRSLKTPQLKYISKWKRKWSTSWHLSISSMRYTNNNPKAPLHNPISNQPGRWEGSASRATRASSPRGKGLDKPHSIPPPHQRHGTTNQSQWTSIKLEHPEGIGEVEEGVHQEEMWPGWRMLESREGFRVHVLIVENRDTSLAIAPQSRNAPICAWPNSSTGVQKTMKATQEQQQSTPSTNNWMLSQKKTKKNWWREWGLRREIFWRPNLCGLD